MKTRKQSLLVTLSLIFLVAFTVIGTIAYLTKVTEPITNTFTVGNIDITLTEIEDVFKMIPGNLIDKDPIVTVKAGSEASYVFVKITESNNLGQFIDYYIDGGWTELKSGVYYRTQDATSMDVGYSVLLNDEVMVKTTVTKAMMDALEVPGAEQPSLTFKAYAIQQANFATPELAWAEVGA